jgi:hypothetical protein
VGSFLLVFPQNPVCIPLLPHACYMPCPSHPPWLDYSNFVWRRVQVVKLPFFFWILCEMWWKLTNCAILLLKQYSFIHQCLYSPLLGPGLIFIFVVDSRTPWTSDQPVARPLTTHRSTQTQSKRTHRHPCLEWDSNLRSQRSSEWRQFMP